MTAYRNLVFCLILAVTLCARTVGAEEEIQQLPSVFNLSTYNNTCNISDDNSIDADQICGKLAVFCTVFYEAMLQAMKYACTVYKPTATAEKIIEIYTLYSKIYEYFPNKTQTLTDGLTNMANVIKTLVSCHKLNQKYTELATQILLANQLSESRVGRLHERQETHSRFNTLLENITSELKEFNKSSESLKSTIEQNRLSGIFLTPMFYEKQLQSNNNFISTYTQIIPELLMNNNEFISSVDTLILLRTWVFLPIMYVELLFGFLGNGLLLTIFIRHREMQTPSNVMLINLTIADLLSLVYYVAWVTIAPGEEMGLEFCRLDMFSLRFFTYLSTYCIVILSYQRFQAVSRFIGRQKYTEKQVAILSTIFLYIISVLLSLPEAIFAKIDVIFCKSSEEEMPYMFYIRSTLSYVVPVIFIVIFSYLSSTRLKESAKNFPGERAHHQERIRNRVIAAWALIGLIVVLAISYIPITISEQIVKYDSSWNFETSEDNIKILKRTFILIYVSRIFFILNPMLNPVTLYFLSSKFRMYFSSYICCRLQAIKNL